MSSDRLAILQMLLWLGPQSQRQVAQATGLSRSRLSVALEALLDEGWLSVDNERKYTGGRRSLQFDLDPSRGVVVGIDIEPGRASFAIETLRGNPVVQSSVDLVKGESPGASVARLNRELATTLAKAQLSENQILGIGIGLPGAVSRTSGILVNPPSLHDWHGFSVRDQLASDYPDAVITVENDANAMALFELWKDRRVAGRIGQESLVVIKMGPDGIGGGLVVNGKLVRGEYGAAGEIGHITVEPNGPRCGCGHEGCLEAVAGPPGIVRLAVAGVQSGESPALSQVMETSGKIKLSDVSRAARMGDEFSNLLLANAGRKIGAVVASLVNIIDPKRLIIGGELTEVGPVVLAAIRQQVFGSASSLSTGRIGIDFSDSGRDASLRGACLIARLAATGLYED